MEICIRPKYESSLQLVNSELPGNLLILTAPSTCGTIPEDPQRQENVLRLSRSDLPNTNEQHICSVRTWSRNKSNCYHSIVRQLTALVPNPEAAEVNPNLAGSETVHTTSIAFVLAFSQAFLGRTYTLSCYLCSRVRH